MLVAIAALLVICAAQWIYIQRLKRIVRRQSREIASWKLAVASYENDRESW